MSAVEGTIVATAVPTIVRDLGGLQLFSWVFATYFLAQAISIPLYGRFADTFGRKRVFYVGTGLFLAGSVLCGFSRSMTALILFRAVQGLGAGGVQPIGMTIVGDIYTPAERARVQGYLSSAWGLAAIIGPILGALLIAHFSWAAVFWVNVPIGILSIALLAFFLDEKIERRPQPRGYLNTILSLDVWRNRIVLTGNLATLAIGALSMAVTAFIPTYVQSLMGGTALTAGIVLGGCSVSWTVGSVGSARVMLRTSYRFTSVFGGVFAVIGAILLVLLTPPEGPWMALAATLLLGLGLGMSNTPFVVAIQSSVPWGQRAAATASNMFTRQIGMAGGTALLGAVLNHGIAAHAAAGKFPALAIALNEVYWVSSVFAVGLFAACLALPRGLSPTREARVRGAA